MISVVAAIQVKPGKSSEFLTIFKANVPSVLAERGCIEYIPMVDAVTGLDVQACDANSVTILEKWEEIEDLKQHMNASHMLSYREKVKDLVENVSIKILKEALWML